MDDRLLVLDLLPLEALLAAGHVEALAILPGRVEQAPGDLGADLGILDRERGRLDRVRTAVLENEVFTNPPRAVARHGLRVLAEDRQAGAHAVRGVPHRRQARPVVGPSVHVLLVAPPKELDPAELAPVVKLPGEEVFAAVDDRLHHHVDLARAALGFDDPPALVDAGRHRHGAGDVLAGLECRDALRAVVGDRRVDVDGVDPGVIQDLLELGVAGRDPETVAAFVQPFCDARQIAYISAPG